MKYRIHIAAGRTSVVCGTKVVTYLWGAKNACKPEAFWALPAERRCRRCAAINRRLSRKAVSDMALRTHYKHIYFEQRADKDWDCLNNKSNTLLGWISWYYSWKNYVFTGSTTSIFDAGCLRDIADFLEQLNMGGE